MDSLDEAYECCSEDFESLLKVLVEDPDSALTPLEHLVANIERLFSFMERVRSRVGDAVVNSITRAHLPQVATTEQSDELSCAAETFKRVRHRVGAYLVRSEAGRLSASLDAMDDEGPRRRGERENKTFSCVCRTRASPLTSY